MTPDFLAGARWAIEQAAKVADAHRGQAAKDRQSRRLPLAGLPNDACEEIRAEERGEDIASEIIATAIRALSPAPEGGEVRKETTMDYAYLDGGALLTALGDDAAKWADAFCKLVPGPRPDQSVMIGWFANAIEHSTDVRQRKAQTAPNPPNAAWRSGDKPPHATLHEIAVMVARGDLSRSYLTERVRAEADEMAGYLLDRAKGKAAASPPAPAGDEHRCYECGGRLTTLCVECDTPRKAERS